MEAKSLFLISTYDEKSKVIVKSNSETIGVRSGNVSFSEIPDGYSVKYSLADLGITISIEISLTDTGVCANIPVEKISEKGNLISISLLPYFFAGEKNENGYLLLPDGSGSMLHFNNEHTTAAEYDVPVYGMDVLSSSVTSPQDVYNVNLPVFGIKKEQSSLFAIITQGAGQASIHATVNGMLTSFTNCYFEFAVRGTDTVVLGETTGLPQTYQMYQKDSTDVKNFTLDYALLADPDADYNTMAQIYREYLKKTYRLEEKKSSSQLFIEFYGATKKKKSFLGFPYTTNEILSVLDNISTIIYDLKTENISGTNVVLKEWNYSQLNNKIDKEINPLSKIGSKKELSKLNEIIKENNGCFYPQFEIQTAVKSGNGVSIYRDAIRNVSNMPAGIYTFKQNTLVKNNDFAKKYFLRVSKQETVLNKLSDSLNDNGLESLSLNSLNVYSDYAKTTVTKNKCANTISSYLKKYLSDKNLAVSYPGDYAFSVTDVSLETPLTSNRYDITNESVPFYQLCLSGLIDCVAPSINLAPEPDRLLLQCLETGSKIQYSLITKDNTLVMNTKLDWLFSADYNICRADIIKSYAVEKQRNEITEGSAMVAHKKLADGISCTVYKNGASVYVNYTDDDYIFKDLTIPANGYCFCEKNGGNK